MYDILYIYSGSYIHSFMYLMYILVWNFSIFCHLNCKFQNPEFWSHQSLWIILITWNLNKADLLLNYSPVIPYVEHLIKTCVDTTINYRIHRRDQCMIKVTYFPKLIFTNCLLWSYINCWHYLILNTRY